MSMSPDETILQLMPAPPGAHLIGKRTLEDGTFKLSHDPLLALALVECKVYTGRLVRSVVGVGATGETCALTYCLGGRFFSEFYGGTVCPVCHPETSDVTADAL